jgi:hypothetical protein
VSVSGATGLAGRQWNRRRANTTLRIESSARKAELIDPLHSVVQKAAVKREGKTAVVEGVLTPDYPIFVRLR